MTVCSSTQFTCRITRQCVFTRFLCDGVSDCIDESDEMFTRCGANPCAGKIRCRNSGRCVPAQTCCNPKIDPTCDKWKRSECCDFPHFPGRNADYPFDKNYRPPNLGNNQESNFNPNWGLQSAVFVIAGCSLAFIALILLLSFVIAKYLLNKISRRTQRFRMAVEGQDSLENLPPIDYHDAMCPNSRLLIQYNINHGVEIFRHSGPGGILPPPYTDQPLSFPLSNNTSHHNYGPPSSDIGAAPPAYSDIVYGENGEISRRQSLKSEVMRARHGSADSKISQDTVEYDYTTIPRYREIDRINSE